MNWRAIGTGCVVALLAVGLFGCGSGDSVDPATLPGAEETTATVSAVPDLVGMTAGQAITAVENSGRVSYTFAPGLHAYTPGAAPGTAASMVTTYAVTDEAVYLRIGSSDATTTVEEPSPWWYENHWAQVRIAGLKDCFGCHQEEYCLDCHAKYGADIEGVKRLAAREELPYEVFRPLAVLGSPYSLKDTQWTTESEPTFTLEGPKDEEQAREAILITLPRIFAEQDITPRVFYEFVEERETESFLSVEVSQETAMATDWDAVTAEELPGVVDSYVWK